MKHPCGAQSFSFFSSWRTCWKDRRATTSDLEILSGLRGIWEARENWGIRSLIIIFIIRSICIDGNCSSTEIIIYIYVWFDQYRWIPWNYMTYAYFPEHQHTSRSKKTNKPPYYSEPSNGIHEFFSETFRPSVLLQAFVGCGLKLLLPNFSHKEKCWNSNKPEIIWKRSDVNQDSHGDWVLLYILKRLTRLCYFSDVISSQLACHLWSHLWHGYVNRSLHHTQIGVNSVQVASSCWQRGVYSKQTYTRYHQTCVFLCTFPFHSDASPGSQEIQELSHESLPVTPFTRRLPTTRTRWAQDSTFSGREWLKTHSPGILLNESLITSVPTSDKGYSEYSKAPILCITITN